MSDELEIAEIIDAPEEDDGQPRWVRNHLKAANEYTKERTRCIGIRLRTQEDAEYIRIYESIPNKTQWFRKALEAYNRNANKREE